MKPSNPYLGALPLRTSRISSIDVDGKAWDSVLFQQSKSILDFDLNVMQRILQENIAQLSRSIFYSGFTRSSSLTSNTEGNTLFLAVSRINALGNIIRLIDKSGTDGRISISISSANNVNTSQYSRIFLWIELWFQEIIPTTISESFDGSSPVEFKSSTIPYGGGVQNAVSTNLTNELYDTTFGSETTRRIQTRWRIRQTPAIDPTPVVAEASSISVTAVTTPTIQTGTIIVPTPTSLSGTITAVGNTVKMYGVDTTNLYPKMILVQENAPTGGNFGSIAAGTTATIVSVDKVHASLGSITIKANGTLSCAVGNVSFAASGYTHGTAFVVPSSTGSQKLITANTTYGFPSETTLVSTATSGTTVGRSDSHTITLANSSSYFSSRLAAITAAASKGSYTLFNTYAYKLFYIDASENESPVSMISDTVSNSDLAYLINTGLANTTYSNKITWTANTLAKQYKIYRNVFRGAIQSVAGTAAGAVYTLLNANSYALPIGTKVTTTGSSVGGFNATDQIVTASTTNAFTIGANTTAAGNNSVSNGVAKPDSLPFSYAQLIDTITLSTPASTVVATGMTATLPISSAVTGVAQASSAALLNVAGYLYSLTGINTTLLKPGMIIFSATNISSGTHRILSITTASSTSGTVLCHGTVAPTTATGTTTTITNLLANVDAATPVYYDNNNTFTELQFTKSSTTTVQAVYPTNVAPFETISGNGGDPRVFAQGGRIEVIFTGSITTGGTLTVTALNTGGYLQVGQRITGIGVPDNVFISGITTAFSSSSGTGTYTVSGTFSSAIASISLYAWFTPFKTFQRSSKVAGFTELYDPYVYVAGDGSSSDASVLNTVDGRVYGLPLAYVYKDDTSNVVLTDLRNVINSLNTGTINATTDITTTNPISGLALRLAASSTGTSLTVSGGGSTSADLSLTPKGSGVVSVATSLTVPAGSATLPSYSFAGQSSTGLYYSVSNAGVSQIGLSVGGTPVVTVSPLSTVFASTLTSAGIVTGTAFSSTGQDGGLAGRYLGRTSNGVPSNGTYFIGDYVVDIAGYVRVYNGTTWNIAGANAADANTWSGLQSFVRSSLIISATADTVINTTIGPGSAVINADLTFNYVSGARFVSPTYSNTGPARTIGSAVNVDIASLPMPATNVSITNSYGLRIAGTATAGATNAYSFYVSGSTGSTSSYAMYVASGLSYFADNVTIAKITKITDATEATSKTADAALVISGGLAVAKKIYADSLYGAFIGTVGAGTGNANTGAFTTLTASDSTDATSKTSGGSVTISGGLAVAKKIYADTLYGAFIGSVGAGATANANTGAFSTLTASNGTDATNSTTGGTVTITGGLAVSGKIYAGSLYGPLTGDVTGNVNGLLSYAIAAGSNADLISATMATNDYFRIRVGGAGDAGYLEIATADNGTEPIYVRQYTTDSLATPNAWSTITRTATLLDGSGNTSFPGTLSANKMSGGAAPRCYIPAAAFTSITLSIVANPTTGAYSYAVPNSGILYVVIAIPSNYAGGSIVGTAFGGASGTFALNSGTNSAYVDMPTTTATAGTSYTFRFTAGTATGGTFTGASIVFG